MSDEKKKLTAAGAPVADNQNVVIFAQPRKKVK